MNSILIIVCLSRHCKEIIISLDKIGNICQLVGNFYHELKKCDSIEYFYNKINSKLTNISQKKIFKITSMNYDR